MENEVQRNYQYWLDMARDVITVAKQDRADSNNSRITAHTSQRIQAGDQVWMYVDKVNPGAKKKLYHL